MSHIHTTKVKLSLFWERIGNNGLVHCSNANDHKTIRFTNYVLFVGILIILSYAFLSLFQFGFKYLSLFFIEFAFSLILYLLFYLNSIGLFLYTRVIGMLMSIVFVSLLNITSGNILGGAYTLLVTAVLPMILFREKFWYSLFYLLHMFAFFAVYYYYQHFSPIPKISKEDINVTYITAAIVMFVLLYFLMQYFVGTNLYFEKQLFESKRVIEEKNKDIVSSIEYAKRLQMAILPSPQKVSQLLPDSFIIYLPKDIVAGDFYWLSEVSHLPKVEKKEQLIEELIEDSSVLIAVCDCTGHGVPGALISMLCSTALNRSLNEFGEIIPGRIFDKSRELVMANFSDSAEEVYDGMDASLCLLNPVKKLIYWSGANNPLWIYRRSQNKLEEFLPDKQPIGNSSKQMPFNTYHNIILEEGDVIYLFTDGFADQFGGSNGKKFSRKRFREMLTSVGSFDMIEQEKMIKQTFSEWKGNHEQVDDICIIGIKLG